MRLFFSYGLSAVAGLTLITLVGCGSGSAVPSTSVTTIATPTPPTIPSVPTSPASPGVPSRAGDFSFRRSNVSGGTPTVPSVFAADGTASTACVLQSVNGFTSAITFPYTVSVRGPVTQPSNTSQTLDSSLATVTVNPATVATLSPGSTPVTVSVQLKATASLPPGSVVTVDIHAEGGGLKRYPSVGPYENSGKFLFYTPYLSIYNTGFSGAFSGSEGSTIVGSARIDSLGIAGTGTLGVTGLPDGATAAFATPTVTLPAPIDDSVRSSLTITATKDIAPGTYPIRLTVTLNGVTYTSDPTNLVVGPVLQI